MVVKGKGGERNVKAGVTLWEKAAAAGNKQAQRNLDKLMTMLRGASFGNF